MYRIIGNSPFSFIADWIIVNGVEDTKKYFQVARIISFASMIVSE